MTARVSPDELSAFIDGELPEPRLREVAAAVAADPLLSARAAAFRRDRDHLRAAFAPVAEQRLPAAWLDRIEAAVERPAAAERPTAAAVERPAAQVLPFRPRAKAKTPASARPPLSPVIRWAAAACLALLLGAGLAWRILPASGDTILEQAEAARAGQAGALASLDGANLPDPARQAAILRQATGLPVRAPDLRRLGWQLAALQTYKGAAELRYRNEGGEFLTVYVRPSAGTPRFDLLKNGNLRVCIWQDDVVGAVIMGAMPAGQMMRVAGLAYADLNL